MSPLLLAPIFAQTITLGLGDRTEARYLVQQDDRRWEGSTTPGAALSFRWRRSSLTFGYSPSFTLTPLDSKPRTLTVYHFVGAQTDYRFRYTTLSLSSGVGFGKINLQVAAVQNPGTGAPDTGNNPPTDGGVGGNQPPLGQPTTPEPGAGAPTDPTTPPITPQEPAVVDRTVRYLTWTTTAGVAHRLTREVSLGATMGYSTAGSYGDGEDDTYTRISGWSVGASASHHYLLSRADSFVTTVSAQRTWSDNDNNVTGLAANEGWIHRYSKRTSSDVGAGLSLTRFAQFDGLVAISVFPTFSAGINHNASAARGGLDLNLRAFSAPVLDTVRATVDPRVGVGASVGWSRDRFSTNLSSSAALSIADGDNEAGAIDSASGSFSMSYNVMDYVAVDSGVRANVQQFRDITVVPPTWAVFAGVSFGYAFTLKGK
jgi:hypothetical protein